MATTVRSATVGAPPHEIWELVADPDHLPRWFPGVVRVENVRPEGFTEIMLSKRGKPMRLDMLITKSSAPDLHGWTQELQGTPFERLLNAWSTTVSIERAADGACVVTITEEQQLKGTFRLGRLLQCRPARRRLDTALEQLAYLLEDR